MAIVAFLDYHKVARRRRLNRRREEANTTITRVFAASSDTLLIVAVASLSRGDRSQGFRTCETLKRKSIFIRCGYRRSPYTFALDSRDCHFARLRFLRSCAFADAYSRLPRASIISLLRHFALDVKVEYVYKILTIRWLLAD